MDAFVCTKTALTTEHLAANLAAHGAHWVGPTEREAVVVVGRHERGEGLKEKVLDLRGQGSRLNVEGQRFKL